MFVLAEEEQLPEWRPAEAGVYAYLLGIYLGDGTIAAHSRRCFGLHVTLDDAYPTVVAEVEAAMACVSGRRVGRHQRPGNHGMHLYSYSPIWPRAFPQHGPGRKHTRKIELAGWQEELIDRDPRPLLRGLIHSDGCRCINRFSVQLKGGPREYEYPRYFFTNYSADIRGIFCRYCDRLGIRWSQSSFKNISVSHRDSVAILDSFAGPKA